MDKRRIFWIVAIIAVLAALAYGVPAFLYSASHQGTDDAKIDADIVSVTNKISERIARILVDTNQPVAKGQLLIVLDDRDERTRYEQALAAYRAQKAQADAALASVALTRDQQRAQEVQYQGEILQARSNITGATMQTASQREQIAVAAAAVDAARAQLRKAQADLRRNEALVVSGDIARDQLDAARAAYQSARSSYEQSLANLSAARAMAAGATTQVSVQQGQLQVARGRLEESNAPSRLQAQEAQAEAAAAQAKSALAQMKSAADALSYTRIVSPIDGYVGEKNVAAGQTVAVGTPLLSLVPKTHVYVTARYKETQIGRMRVGQPVDIRIDAYPGVLFQGRVASLSPASENVFSLVPAQNATANFVKVTQRVPVRIAFDASAFAYPLRPGMSVEAYVDIDR